MGPNQPFSKRFKAARLAKSARLTAEGRGRYSLESLGRDAGIAEESARQRAHQYESGKHLPELGQAIRFAEALNVPLAYLFCIEDDLAELLLLAHVLNEREREQLLEQARLLGSGPST